MWKLVEGLQRKAWRVFSNPQSRQSRYFTEKVTLTTHNEIVDELNHSILAKVSQVIHTFEGYGRIVHETQEGQ